MSSVGHERPVLAYGLSETSPNICMSWHDDDPEKRVSGWAHILDGIKVSIVDAGNR